MLPFKESFYSDKSKREIDNYWMETHLNPRQLKRSFVFTPRKELRRQMKESSFVNSSTCFLQPCRSYPGPGLSWLLHKMTVAKLFWSGHTVIYHQFNYIFSKLAFIIWLQHQKLQIGSFVQIKILENNRSRIYAKMHDNSIVVSLSPWIQLHKFLLSEGL